MLNCCNKLQQAHGGVDLSDQTRSYYDVGRQAKKFWKGLAWYLINLCVINSFLVYRETLVAAQRPHKSHLHFREQLIDYMIGGYTSRKRAGRHAHTPVVEESQLAGHDLIKAEKKLACRNCTQTGRRTPAGRCVQSTFKCRICNVNLCKDGCLLEYHRRHTTK